MNGETMVRLLFGVLVRVAGTVTMDVLASVSRKLGLAMGAKGQWVGRWYLGITQGRFVYADITAAPEQPGETRAALVGHYIIGITLAVLYVGMARSLLISARADGSFNTHSITRRFLLFAPPCLRRDCAAL